MRLFLMKNIFAENKYHSTMKNIFSDTPEESAGYLLSRVYALRSKKMNTELSPLGINYVHYNLLAALYWLQLKGEKVNQMLLINTTKLDKSVVSNVIAKMVKEGYLNRTEDENDTRAKLVKLTAKGEDLTERAVTIVTRVDNEFIGNKDMEPLVKYLKDILNNNK